MLQCAVWKQHEQLLQFQTKLIEYFNCQNHKRHEFALAARKAATNTTSKDHNNITAHSYQTMRKPLFLSFAWSPSTQISVFL